MNLAAIDLNLLVAFDALMQEQHVTRAGRLVGLAQPSMSCALARLRILFEDQLFTRVGQTMQPTAKAMALALPISAALEQLRRAVDPNLDFEPGTAQTRFTVATTDYGNLIVLPKVMAAVRREAPGVDVRVLTLTNRAQCVQQLERGEIDVMICYGMPASPRIVRHTLFLERFVCIRDASRASIEGPLSKAEYAKLPHAWCRAEGGDAPTSGDSTILAAAVQPGETHRVALMLSNLVAVPFAVAGTDLIATISERVAQRLASAAGVAIVVPPFDQLPPFSVRLAVARSRSDDAALRWFVNLVRRESRDI